MSEKLHTHQKFLEERAETFAKALNDAITWARNEGVPLCLVTDTSESVVGKMIVTDRVIGCGGVRAGRRK